MTNGRTYRRTIYWFHQCCSFIFPPFFNHKGISITWDRKSQVLTFSTENESFTGLCLVVQNTSVDESCSSVTGAECVEPGSKDTFDSNREPVVVIFGRGLCSKPANLTGEAYVRILYGSI